MLKYEKPLLELIVSVEEDVITNSPPQIEEDEPVWSPFF